MSSVSMSFKAKVKNYAKKNHLPAQVILQNIMFERFLDRLSRSDYRDKFVIKGGMLISAIVGLDTRSTMDLDATLRKLTLTEDQIREAINNICSIDLQDDITFKINSVAPIRKEDIYGGYRVKLDAKFEQIITPLSIDVSTGDIITPDAVKYEISGIFDDSVRITLWGYSIETILAEKTETILSRDITNTRPRDYYDVYILRKKGTYDPAVYRSALIATAQHRGSWNRIRDFDPITSQIENSIILKDLWEKYRKEFNYAKDISFEDTVSAVRSLLSVFNDNRADY